MVWTTASEAGGALTRLRCPHCGEVQARVRKPPESRYRCRKCKALFTREEGMRAAREGGGEEG